MPCGLHGLHVHGKACRVSLTCQVFDKCFSLLVVTLIDTQAVEDGARRVVRMLMARDGVSQADMAEVLGVAQQQVSQRLAGKARFRFSELVVLAEHFGVTIADFGPASRFLDVGDAAVRSHGRGLLPSTKYQHRRSEGMDPTLRLAQNLPAAA